jgi:hypothetical protein
VRDFIARELPAETRERMVAGKSPTKDMVVDWQRKLNAKGWAVPEWPESTAGRVGRWASATSSARSCSRRRRRSRSPSTPTCAAR